jgi:Protein of unknown function (DUF3106)
MQGIKSISCVLLTAALALSPAVVSAQQRKAQQNNAPRLQAPPGNGGWAPKGPGPHRGEWLRNNKDLPLQEQEKKLQSDPSFQALPPERQQQLKNRLERFNSLPPDQRERVLQRMETWEHLTPQKQQEAMGIFDRMKNMPPDRRTMMRSAYRNLEAMSPQERQRVLDSDRFKSMFNDDERDLLKRSLDLNLAHEGEPQSH